MTIIFRAIALVHFGFGTMLISMGLDSTGSLSTRLLPPAAGLFLLVAALVAAVVDAETGELDLSIKE